MERHIIKEIFPIQHVTQWQAFPRSWANEPCFELHCPADPVDVLLDLDSGYVKAIVHSIMMRRNYALYAGCVMTGVVLLTTEDNVHAGIGVAQGIQYVIHTTLPCQITMNDDNKQLHDWMPNKLAAWALSVRHKINVSLHGYHGCCMQKSCLIVWRLTPFLISFHLYPGDPYTYTFFPGFFFFFSIILSTIFFSCQWLLSLIRVTIVETIIE